MTIAKCIHCGDPVQIEEESHPEGIECELCELTVASEPQVDEFSDADPGL